jgi:hypothetical protein
MSTPLSQKVLICLIVVIMSSALSAVDTGVAMLYSHGTTWLNGTSMIRSSAIFSGDLVQTKADSVASINASGSMVRILSDSLVQFEGNAVKLEHGGVAVVTSKAMATKAGDVTVVPATTNGWVKFAVKDLDGKVQIAAEKGDLIISDDTGTSTLPEGQQTTRDESNSQHSKNKRTSGGAAHAATGALIDSRVATGVGIAAIGGVTAWVLLQGDDPVSPAKP